MTGDDAQSPQAAASQGCRGAGSGRMACSATARAAASAALAAARPSATCRDRVSVALLSVSSSVALTWRRRVSWTEYLASAIRPARLAWPPKNLFRSSMNHCLAYDSSLSKISSTDGRTDQDPFAFGCSHWSGEGTGTLRPYSRA